MTAQRGSRPRPDDSRKRGRQGVRPVRRRGFATALLPLLAFPFSATAQSAPETLTLAEVRALPTEALARRLLGASAMLVQEAAVQGGVGQWDNPDRLDRVVFAGASRSTGRPGLCQADRIAVVFGPPGTDTVRAAAPFVIRDLTRDSLYRIVDAGPVPASGWSDGYGKALDAACARLGPVLTHGPVVGATFFENSLLSAPTGLAAQFHARVLADTIQALHAGAGPVLECQTPLPDPCRQQVANTAEQPSNAIRTEPCQQNHDHWCVEVRFDTGWLRWTTLTIETDRTDDLLAPVRLHHAMLAEHVAIE